MSNYKTIAIVNPHSANGATGRKLDKLKSILLSCGDCEIALTEAPTHATVIAVNALKDGYNRIIAVGGDGTFNEVVNGFFENDEAINPDAVLGLISAGTGADFIKTIGLPVDWTEAIKKIKNDRKKKIDLGLIEYFMEDNSPKKRYFINVAGAGISGSVVKKVNSTSKILGGFASFLAGTISTVLEYQNKRTEIIFDDQLKIEKITNNVIIGNGKFIGGGMKVLPDALPDDGFFDVLIIGDISKFEFFENVPKIYKGTHLENPKLDLRRAKTVQINSSEKILLDIDGEQEGFTPAKFTVIPSALSIFC